MKKKAFFSKSVSALIAVVIAVTAFTREPLRLWLLGGTFAAWLIYLIIMAARQTDKGKARIKSTRKPKTIAQRESLEEVFGDVFSLNGDETVLDAYTTESLLLRHVNHRISSRLKAVYPDATWDWASENPETIITDCGTGRIKLCGADEYTHADVTFDKSARITLDLIQIKRMEKSTSAALDPDAWFTFYGEAALMQITEDLASRGYSELTIRNNGDIFIQQSTGEKKVNTLGRFPDTQYLPRIADVIKESGYGATLLGDSLNVTWNEEGNVI